MQLIMSTSETFLWFLKRAEYSLLMSMNVYRLIKKFMHYFYGSFGWKMIERHVLFSPVCVILFILKFKDVVIRHILFFLKIALARDDHIPQVFHRFYLVFVTYPIFYFLILTCSFSSWFYPDDHRSVTSQIKEHIKTCRKMLISKLEPLKLASFLSSSVYFSQSEIDRINACPTRSGRVIQLLSFIEDGNLELVENFVSALTNAGFKDLVKLLDPVLFHSKAG